MYVDLKLHISAVTMCKLLRDAVAMFFECQRYFMGKI